MKCSHRDCHRTILIKVNSKSSHWANSIYRILCVVYSTCTWVCGCTHRGQSRGHQVSSITFCWTALRQGLHHTGSSFLPGWLPSKPHLSLVPQRWGLRPCPAFYMGVWDLNSGRLFVKKGPYPLSHFFSSHAISWDDKMTRIGRTGWYCQNGGRRPGSGKGLKLEKEILTSNSR